MILSPSVLSLDYSEFSESVSILNERCSWLHFDVMDGHFVPNLTFGPDILKAFRKSSSLYMDVHLMVTDPKFFTDVFCKAGADGITFHFEALDCDVEKSIELLRYIKSKYVKAGISIKPGTNVEDIKDLLAETDLVLVMSVEPGFGGQAFMPNSLDKIKWLDDYRKENNLNYLIEVDGGVNEHNAYELCDKGCDILVAGSSVFKGDIESNIDKLEHASK